MTGDELHAILTAIDRNPAWLAGQLQTDERRVRRWLQDRPTYPIPEPVAVWLRALRLAHDALPPPPAQEVWRTWERAWLAEHGTT